MSYATAMVLQQVHGKRTTCKHHIGGTETQQSIMCVEMTTVLISVKIMHANMESLRCQTFSPFPCRSVKCYNM